MDIESFLAIRAPSYTSNFGIQFNIKAQRIRNEWTCIYSLILTIIGYWNNCIPCAWFYYSQKMSNSSDMHLYWNLLSSTVNHRFNKTQKRINIRKYFIYYFNEFGRISCSLFDLCVNILCFTCMFCATFGERVRKSVCLNIVIRFSFLYSVTCSVTFPAWKKYYLLTSFSCI